MDTVTLIGIIGSIVSIVSFLISLFMQSSKNIISTNNKTTSNNINNSFNSNSFNTTNNSTNINIYKTYTSSNSSTDIDNLIAALIAIFSVVFIKFYINQQTKIISNLILFISICYIINIIIILLICKKSYNSYHYYTFNRIIFNWMPLFILLASINIHLYSSPTLTLTVNLIKQIHGLGDYLTMFSSHPYDNIFITLQMYGIIMIFLLTIQHLIITMKDLISAVKKHQIEYKKSSKDIFSDIFIYAFIFIFTSGLLSNSLAKLTSLQKPL